MPWLLVIGGNSDIGFSTAKIFASYGYNVHLASRDIDQLNLKKKIIEKTYSVICKISLLDLYDTESTEEFLKNNKINPKIILVAAGYMENPEILFKKIIKNSSKLV